jgi:tRNA-2-methylthio-N6-dimethylallyladenosine synthase
VTTPLVQIRARDPQPVAASEPAAHVADDPSLRVLPMTSGARVYVETHGCQMNVADSELLMGVLTGAGYVQVGTVDDADVVVVNTCAVREKAETKVVNRAHELGAMQRKRPAMIISIVGCMAEHLKAGLADLAPVDVIAGPDSYRRLPELLAEVRARRNGGRDQAVVDVTLDKAETYEGLDGADSGDGVTGFVTIQRGCDKFCTFCVVPFTRGRERGTAPREVLRQVRSLVARGYKEVTLLGQTVNSYVWDDTSFADLLRAVARVDGLERIRFTSPYPVDFTDDVIAAIASEPKVGKYVHLPVQSGSDPVLARMRRGYTVDDYRAIVARLRAAAPGIALSTDILTGFSGETEDDHGATLALMREIRFDSAFMFAYSERDLTYAAKKLTDDVPAAVKQRRLREIVALQDQISSAVFAAAVGKPARVLVHHPSKRNPDEMMGRTDDWKTVILPAGVGRAGQLLDVTITRATQATLFGSPR